MRPQPHAETPGTTATYSLAALGPADTIAVCSALGLPLPTPDVPLEAIAEHEGLTARDVWSRLAHTTDVRCMIAAATIRGTVTRLPPDPRLDPKPHARAPVKVPLTDDERARSPRPPAPPPVRLSTDRSRRLASVAPNPKRPGSASWDRYQLYRVGETEAEHIARGVLPADIRWDSTRGFVVWSEA